MGIPRALRVAIVAAAAASLSTTAATAQSADKYPDKPIKIIVPFAPGGSTDIIARVIGQKMLENWGQQVIVETRPGAATVIGTAAVAQAAPDGYTLLITVSNLATNPALQPSLPYDAVKDFEPISMLGHMPVVPYVNPKFPPKTIKELIDYGKANPVPFGSAGIASMTHLAAEAVKDQYDVKLMQHVVYRGGAPALTDALAGTIPMTMATVLQALPQYQAGQLGALGVTAEKRHRSLPNVPTFREQGIDMVVTEWYGLFAPKGTPKPIVDKLNAEMKRILALDLGDRLQAIDLQWSTPDQLGQHLRKETDRWSPIIKKLGLKAQ